MKKLIMLPILTMMSLTILNCSKESSNKSANNQIICPAGTYYNGTNCVTNIIPNQNQNSYVSFISQANFIYQTKTLTTGSDFSTFLEKVMGACNRAHANGGWANCTSFSGGPKFISISARSTTSNDVSIMIGASPKVDPYFNYTYQLPSWRDLLFGMPIDSYAGAYYNPLGITGKIYPYNNSQGFEILADGPAYSTGFNGRMHIVVTKGKLEDTSFAFTVTFDFHDYDANRDYNLNLMSGTMYRQ